MIKEFRFRFDDLKIKKSDIGELMGFDSGDIPEPFPDLIDIALKKAPSICHIKGGYKVFNRVEINDKNQAFTIDGLEFNPSKTVLNQFKGACSFALLLCTAGREISDHAKEIGLKGDPLLSYVLDTLGSVVVDKATEKLLESLEKEYLKTGLGISDIFSPGYCEWSVAEQQILFALLPENFCGITLSDSSLMSPIKSVSGIVGIGKELQQKGYQCNWCTQKNCIYGKIKRKKK
jgi:hypothetical protein